jgi:hypothetical protein
MVMYGTARYGTTRHGTVQYGMAWYGTACHDTAWYDTVWYGTAWYGTVQHDMVPVRYSTDMYGVAQRYGMTRHDTVQYGKLKLWLQFVWYGTV